MKGGDIQNFQQQQIGFQASSPGHSLVFPDTELTTLESTAVKLAKGGWSPE